MEKRKIFFGIIAIGAVISLPSFLEHLNLFLSGQISRVMVQNRWDFVLINIAVFLAFLIPLKYRKKFEWKSMGIYSAFIASLFIEMYGIPLTVYLSSSFFSPVQGAARPDYLFTFYLLGQGIGISLWMLIGLIITSLGAIIVGTGWWTLYKNKGVVTKGIYNYSRHPQYLGIILIALGWVVGWPSILTLSMFPILLYSYYKISKREEREVIEEFDNPEEYINYMNNTPLFI